MEMEKEVLEVMNLISAGLDSVKVELAKANERKLKGTSLNCAAMKRARKCLVDLEKLGYTFRRVSIAYQKELNDV